MTSKSNNRYDAYENVILTTRELAQCLHVHINTVRRWSDLGFIHSCRIGPRRDRRFYPHEVTRFHEQGHELYDRQT